MSFRDLDWGKRVLPWRQQTSAEVFFFKGNPSTPRSIWRYATPRKAWLSPDQGFWSALPSIDESMAEGVRRLQNRRDNKVRREQQLILRQARLDAKAQAAAEAAKVARAVQRKQEETPEPEKREEEQVETTPRATPRRKQRRKESPSPEPREKLPAATSGGNWTRGLQFPQITLDELWDMLGSPNGQVSPFLSVHDFIENFMLARQFVITKDLAESLMSLDIGNTILWSREDASTLSHAPLPISKAQLGRLCSIHMFPIEDKTWTRPDILEELLKVEEHNPEAEVSDFGIELDSFFRLAQFKRIMRDAAWLMRIPETIIIAEMAWFVCGALHIPHKFGTMVMNLATTDKGNDIAALQVASSDMTRLSYAFRIVDVYGRKGVPISKVTSTFMRTLKKLSELMDGHTKKRPHHWLWRQHANKKKDGVPKMVHTWDDRDIGRKNPHQTILGWSEFSALLIEIYKVLPVAMFGSPLEICAKFLANLDSAPIPSRTLEVRGPLRREPIVPPQMGGSGHPAAQPASASETPEPPHRSPSLTSWPSASALTDVSLSSDARFWGKSSSFGSFGSPAGSFGPGGVGGSSPQPPSRGGNRRMSATYSNSSSVGFQESFDCEPEGASFLEGISFQEGVEDEDDDEEDGHDGPGHRATAILSKPTVVVHPSSPMSFSS